MAGVCEGERLGHTPGDEPQTLTRCHSCGLSCHSLWVELYLWLSLQLKGYKEENVFIFFSFLSFVSFLL